MQLKHITRLCRCTADRSAAVIAACRTQSTYQNLEYGLEKKWAYYNQDAIDKEAAKPLTKLTPFQLMYTGKSTDGSHLLKSAQFLQKELPRRLARRVKDFQSLPYVILINPTMQEVYELYLRAFHKLSRVPPIDSKDDEKEYSNIVAQLLEDHKQVVTSLAKAFHEVKGDIPYDILGALTERTLTSRLAIRLLAEHHLGMRYQSENFIGVIATKMSPKKLIEKCVFQCKEMCEHKFGYSPAVFVSGHTQAKFAHLPAPIEYILQELLKNAMKATVLHHIETPREMPPLEVTICNNSKVFIIRISDRGGGIPDEIMKDIFKYSFSTTKQEEEKSYLKNTNGNGTFNALVQASNAHGLVAGTLSGYGFGLPSCLAYAKFLGGSLNVIPMYGFGTDVFLKLSHIYRSDCFRI